jgi:hypothetical protein
VSAGSLGTCDRRRINIWHKTKPKAVKVLLAKAATTSVEGVDAAVAGTADCDASQMHARLLAVLEW